MMDTSGKYDGHEAISLIPKNVEEGDTLMKRIGTIAGVLLVFILICACQRLSLPKMGELHLFEGLTKSEPEYQNRRMSSLSPDILLAIDTLDAAREGTLDSFPYARISPDSKVTVDDTKAHGEFCVGKMGIVKYDEKSDALQDLTIVTEAQDNLGRIDLRTNRLVYTVQQPNDREAKVIAQHIKKTLTYTKGASKEVQEATKRAIKEFQEKHGLKADGIIGNKTAEMYSQDAKVLDVKELNSLIIYPTEPRSTFFIIPYDTVASAPDQFNKGYASLNAVKQHALSAEKFEKLAVPGSKFIMFLYFRDRVSPGKPIRMCLADSENRWTKSLSPIKYAQPKVWSVITEILSIDDKMEATRLYVNVFVKGKYMYRCIASHRIM